MEKLERYKANCFGNRRHLTQTAAMLFGGRIARHVGPQRPWFCNYCQGWHLRNKIMTGTYIAAAALLTNYGQIFTLPPPARHHNLIQHFKFAARPNQQGFVTNEGKFVSHHAAFLIAQAAGQIVQKHGSDDKLFSEDLW